MVEERAGGDSSSEPLGTGEADNKRAEQILHLFVRQVLARLGEGLGGLLTHHSLVLARQHLQEWQENRLFTGVLKAVAKLFCDREQDFVIFSFDQG